MSASRSYEYAVDDLRLTLLSHGNVVEHLRGVFSFEQAEITRPPETYGPVLVTSPPGLLLGGGLVPGLGERIGTIRMITVDARRLVIEVAGPSSEIALVFDHLMESLSEVEASDGGKAFGTPVSTQEHSELSFWSASLLEGMIAPEISEVLKKYGLPRDDDHAMNFIPSLRAKFQERHLEYFANPTDMNAFSIDMRSGDTFDRGLLYSAAPLDSDTHLAMLDEIEQALA